MLTMKPKIVEKNMRKECAAEMESRCANEGMTVKE